ncbi:NADH-quinone oxidoreductase subunit L [Paenibacillaceae bacterium]|nr:NADH-quinone oxidoreductase subunit L [Paenibacillaceae bacterium]
MDTVYSQYAWLIPVFPLIAFLIITALGRGARHAAVLIALTGSLLPFLLSLLVLMEQLGSGEKEYSERFTWLAIGDFHLAMGIEVTHLTALMLAVVTFISLLVNLYSASYMSKDERIAVYYGYVALFTFAMLGLVLSDNLLTMYIFWELVGVCSFLLVGFWYAKPAARAAAKKAFIVTRVGDVGLLLAILLLFWHMPDHTLDFANIHNVFADGQHSVIGAGMTTLIAILIFVGAMGKSGQFPLHVWLPDAMEGPTPISALIHAATMVAAGVFLVVRTFDIFMASPAAMEVVAYIGAFTAIFAASIALVQSDIKRILAYSTISQLGYMMLALGLGSISGGVFHLFTHAFFKALLFLGAGSVIHALHTQNIHEMGGVGARMKITTWTFGIGALALIGIPPFSGFWSKDAILTVALANDPLLFAVGVVTALLTALYMSRLFFLVFLGKPKGGGHVRESNRIMTIPLIVLAVFAAISGFVEMPWSGLDRLSRWLPETVPNHDGNELVMIISTAVGALGIYLGWLVYVKGSIARDTFSARLPWLMRLLERKYYMDEFFRYGVIVPLQYVGRTLQAVDDYIVDGVVRLVAAGTLWTGRGVTRSHNGQIQTYGLLTALGIIALLIAIVGRRFW